MVDARIDRVDNTPKSRSQPRVTGRKDEAVLREDEQHPQTETGPSFDREALGRHVEKLNRTLRIFDKHLAFDIHEETERVMVEVIDLETEEVLREIPPEEILNIVARIDQMVGVIVDERI